MWQSLIWFYSPGQTQQTAVIYLFAAGCAAIAAPFLWLGVMIISLKKLITKDLLLIECFCFIYMVALFVWSYFGATPQVFARFIFPLAGLLPVIFSYRFSSHVQRGAIKVLLIAFVLINTFNMARLYGFNDDVLVTVNNNQEMFSWIKKNTDPQGHFMFWEPRTVALMTKRVGTTLAWLSFNPNDQWHIILRQKNIRFLILNKTGDKEFIKYFYVSNRC